MLYKTNNPHGGNALVNLDYSININPLGTPRGVLDAIAQALPQVHNYPDPYCRELVHTISEFEGVLENYILCGNGAAELIYSYCDAVRPRCAVEIAPTFSEYSSALERVGCAVERYVLKRRAEFELDGAFLDYLKDKRPEAVFLCNPNNPTGRIIPLSLMEKILHFCKENSTYLFVDECFLELTDGVSVKNYITKYPQLFILKAFTKSYGLAGIRLGYCVSADVDLLSKMSKCIQPWNVSSLAQVAGIAALKEQNFLKKAKEIIKKERKWLEAALANLGFWVCPSDANYLLVQGCEGLDAELDKYGIAIRNCDNFYGLSAGWYRIAVRIHAENERLIDTIKTVHEKR